MFLALKEIQYYKSRYRLVVGVIFLITYMVFFLSSLAEGLARNNRLALESFGADTVLLSDYANKNLVSSSIDEESVMPYLDQEKVAQLGQLAVVANQEGQTKKVNAQVFGLDWQSFLAPQVIQGRAAKMTGELVVDQSLEQKGLKLGDKLQLNGSTKVYEIVGLTKEQLFFTQPVLFMSLDDFRELKYGSNQLKKSSALFIKRGENLAIKDLSQLSLKQVIENIPGYQAQVLTFRFMIGAMVVITFLVLGIFIYILTIQKISLYGIMRAQGIATKTIIWSIFCQIFILASLGMTLAALCLLGTQPFLPPSMPFYSDWQAYAVLTGAILIMSLAGGFLSIRKVWQIDPLQAIGGE